MRAFERMIRFALLACFINWCSAKYFIAAPNLIRLGVEETVSITIYNVAQAHVKVYLQDFPHRKRTFSQVEGNFVKDKPGELLIKVNAKDLSDQKSLDKQYIYLVATSSTPGASFLDEIKILVSFRNSMVFIQTDKPIYTPGQTVHLRVIPLDLNLKASLNNVTIDIFNPQGIRVDRWRNLNTKEGFFSKRKDLSENAFLGNWRVSALYGHGLVQIASVEFEVKEYVLPTFSVKIDGPPFILETDQTIKIKVTSKYTYGKGVLGKVQLSLGVLDKPGKPPTRFATVFPDLIDGVAKDDHIDLSGLKKHKDINWFPEGKRLFIEAKVTETATGKQEKALDTTIYFTKSPYKISFKRTPMFFKPGVPFEIKVDVTYVNGKPANGISLEIEAKTDVGDIVHERQQNAGNQNSDTSDVNGHGSFVVDVPKKFTINYLDIIVRTKTKNPAEYMFQPRMYQSSGNNYLFVKAPKAEVGKSVYVFAFVLTNTNPKSLSYLVVGRGKILAQGTIVRDLGIVTSIRIDVTSLMSPQARIIVYYVAGNEVVVDSTLMEAKEQFPNKVKFLGKLDVQKYPAQQHKIEIESDPYSRVGILAVDKSVYLLRNDKQLTYDTVFNRMKSHDLGCGWGGGQNNNDVLTKAGLAVMTDYGLKTSVRDEYKCAAVSRKRRSISTTANFLTFQEKKCCELGETKGAPRKCLEIAASFAKSVDKSLYPMDKCVIAFYICCKRKFPGTGRGRSADLGLPPDLLNNLAFEMEEDDMFEEIMDDAQVRTNFPETWLYEDCLAGKNGKVEFHVTIPDTITSWVMQAIAVSNTTGFGLTPPYYLKAFKQFFTSFSMPYSAQRGEQVSILATVYNYNELNHMGGSLPKVSLYLRGSRDFCSNVQSDKKLTIYRVLVGPMDAKSVSFPIVPLVTGDIIVEITAVSPYDADTKQRVLKVLPEGKQRRKTHSVLLDPQGVLEDPKVKTVKPTKQTIFKTADKGNGVQKNSFLLSTPNSTVQDSESARLLLMGNLIGPVVANVIEGGGLKSIIKLPTGCGEQTMLKLAPNVYVMQYLRSTRQVTPQIEKVAFDFIKSGYQRELNYRRSDNSFSAFGNNRAGSTWLTAFVIKTFCAAQKFGGVDIDGNVICTAMSYLSGIQRADGAIPERQPVIHQEMNGDINGDIAMTAYVVTAFKECSCPSINSVDTVNKAVTYLEKIRPKINRVYVKAVVAYALALVSSPERFAANQDLLLAAHYDPAKNTRYWKDGGNAINVETTSYALLTQLEMGRMDYSGAIVVWLTEQRKGGGGFVSTQDTCVALQALAAYSQATGGNRLDLTVEITSSKEHDFKRTLRVNKKNALVQQQLDITFLIGDEIYISTTGAGVAQLQVEVTYNTPPSEKEICQFELTVDTIEEQKSALDPIKNVKTVQRKRRRRKGPKRNRNRRRKGRRRGRGRGSRRRNNKPSPAIQRDQPEETDSIVFKVCVRSTKVGGTGMSIIDVGILTGFSVIEQSVKDLKENVKPGIMMYETSDRHLILYLDKVPHNHSLCFPLKMKRDYDVGSVQPVAVEVYDYYEPDVKCTTFYRPKDNSALNLALCEKDKCKCLLDKCTSCNPSNNVNHVVNKLYCSTYDYAFRGEVRAFDEKDNSLKIKVDVKEVFKSSKVKLKIDERIVFTKRSNCDCPRIMASTIDTEYLFMGKDSGLKIRKARDSTAAMDNNVFIKEWKTSGDGSKFFKNFARKTQKDPCS